MDPITVADALRMALRLERLNCEEYRAGAREASSPALRKMFSFLAGEEEKHIAIVRAKMAEHGVGE